MELVDQLNSKTIDLFHEINELKGALNKHSQARLQLQELQGLVREILGVEVIHTDN